MAIQLTTNGLGAPLDFPAGPYEAVHAIVVSKWMSHALYEHYAGSWNAVAYRYVGANDAGQEFDLSLEEHGASPTPVERYRQEQALFTFFSSGFSTFEAAFYALYVIGAFLEPTGFSLASEKDQQRVSPAHTSIAFKAAFVGDPILAGFDRVFADPAYQQWREIRNVLTHRTAPGRRMYVSIGTDDAPPVEWKLKNITLDRALVPARQGELARLLGELLSATEAFLAKRI